jgi:hypothetical protein
MLAGRPGPTAGEDVLAAHLREAAAILAAASGPPDLSARPAGVTSSFEHLRWFDLPRSAVQSPVPRKLSR